jgi:hypothetical protein
MPKSCSFPACHVTQGGSSALGWLCTQKNHVQASVDEFARAIGMSEESVAHVVGLAENLGDLKEVEEEDIASLELKVVTAKKLRRALQRLGNKHLVQVVLLQQALAPAASSHGVY